MYVERLATSPIGRLMENVYDPVGKRADSQLLEQSVTKDGPAALRLADP